MSRQRVLLSDIAAACSVSVSTVSRALKGNPQIASETRTKIIAEASHQNYRALQTRLAQSQQVKDAAVKATVKKLVVVEYGIDISSYFSEALREIARISSQFSLDAVFVSENAKESLSSCLQNTVALNPDAIILLTWANLNEADAQLISKTGIPTILLNRHVAGACNAVICDNFAAGVHMAKYFYNLGHRRIAHLIGPQSASTVRDREDGFRSELLRLHCYDPELFGQLDMHNMLDSINTWVQRFLHLQQPCTAIWAYNDAAAAIAYTAVRNAGLTVPGDISIAGFDNMIQNLNLTTFDNRQNEMGRVAVNMVVDLLTNTMQGPVRACVVPEFVEGQTSGPVLH